MRCKILVNRHLTEKLLKIYLYSKVEQKILISNEYVHWLVFPFVQCMLLFVILKCLYKSWSIEGQVGQTWSFTNPSDRSVFTFIKVIKSSTLFLLIRGFCAGGLPYCCPELKYYYFWIKDLPANLSHTSYCLMLKLNL